PGPFSDRVHGTRGRAGAPGSACRGWLPRAARTLCECLGGNVPSLVRPPAVPSQPVGALLLLAAAVPLAVRPVVLHRRRNSRYADGLAVGGAASAASSVHHLRGVWRLEAARSGLARRSGAPRALSSLRLAGRRARRSPRSRRLDLESR